MKLDTMLKAMLMLLCVALMVTLMSWFTSQHVAALADGPSSTDGWMMVSADANSEDGFIYMFSAKKETLLIYAYYRRQRTTGSARMQGDLEFLAGRHVKWDILLSQLQPYPYAITGKRMSTGAHTPAQIKTAFDKLSRE
jgi:hypothetical protein